MIEICCGSYQDGLVAWKAGAKRIELNSALSVGGLTPSLSSLIRLKKETDLKIICMLRDRTAGFSYEKEEVKICSIIHLKEKYVKASINISL